MAKSLKEIYGLREMAVTVPDQNVASLRSVIKQAILDGQLPGEALGWLNGAGVPDVPVKGRKGKKAADIDDPKNVDKSMGGGGRTEFPLPGQAAQAPAKAVAKTTSPAQAATPAPPPPQQPVSAKSSKTPGGWASWKAQTDPSAWDALANGTQAAPAKPKAGMFDPDSSSEFPSFPDSAAAKAAAKDVPAQPAVMEPKRGALSRIFGKKVPKVAHNPEDDRSLGTAQNMGASDQQFAAASRKGRAFADRDDDEPQWTPGGEGGENAMDDLQGTLKQRPHQPAPTGADAIGDLDFAIHGKTKRRKK